jgi:hypothetical protein
MLSPQALQSLSPLALQTLSGVAYTVLVLSTACSIGISCIGILSQAVRTSPSRSWARNYDALVIGASYVIVVSCPPTPHPSCIQSSKEGLN